MSLLIDVFLIVSIILIAYLGWSAGLTRTFFAVFAGFLAIFAADKYPYQEGLNFYLVFLITAILVIIAGGFVLRIVSFFFMKPFDKAGGAVLSAAVWLIVSVNVIIPTLTYGTHALDGATHTVYKTISSTMHTQIPLFKDYIPSSLEKKVMERRDSEIN